MRKASEELTRKAEKQLLESQDLSKDGRLRDAKRKRKGLQSVVTVEGKKGSHQDPFSVAFNKDTGEIERTLLLPNFYYLGLKRDDYLLDPNDRDWMESRKEGEEGKSSHFSYPVCVFVKKCISTL